MTHILLIYNRMNLGGIQVKIIDILNEIQKQPGIKVTLVLRKPQGIFHNQIPKKTRVIALNTGKKLIDAITIIRKLRKIIQSENPDVILTFADHISSLTLLTRKTLKRYVPVVVSEEILLSPYLAQQRAGTIRALATKILYRQADQILVMTEAMKKDLTHNFSVPEKQISTIHNWVSPRFIQKLRQGKIKVKSDVLYVGRLEPQKNLELFIQVIKEIAQKKPLVKAIIVGSGTQEKILKGMVRELKLVNNISFAGPQIDTTPYYRGTKVFLLTSHFEGQPLVMLQAMAAKLPVIATNIPGIEETISPNKSGLIANDAPTLTQHILKLLKNKKWRNKIGHEGFKKVQTANNSKNIQQIILKLESACYSESPKGIRLT